MRSEALQIVALDSSANYGPEDRALHVLHDRISRYEEQRRDLLSLNMDLNRRLVSFQANKSSPLYRLFKYKEGFSASLVEYFVDHFKISEGPILDPFSGTGTTNIVVASRSIPSTGIELLPIGDLVARSRSEILRGLSDKTVTTITEWKKDRVWAQCDTPDDMVIMRITKGAYPEETEYKIRQFLTRANKLEGQTRTILLFALCSVLEETSYTRKDGQYLRWDHRSARQVGKRPFDKGQIYSFDDAIDSKLGDILDDVVGIQFPTLFDSQKEKVEFPIFLKGSSLSVMQGLPDNHFSAVITSPPYCNRYDYTRTYALELAALGVSEKELISMRQAMLSCTVESKEKDLLALNADWEGVIEYTKNHHVLKPILSYLWDLKASGQLNNNGIPRMIDGYFSEMACIIYECYRVLRKNGVVAMVNDNVRYAGVPIPVDLILSEIAQSCGFSIDKIMVLPKGKGNSSQQMGAHGRSPLRKCVYVWRK